LCWNFESVRIVTNGSWIIKSHDILENLRKSEIDWGKISILISDDCYHREFRNNSVQQLQGFLQDELYNWDLNFEEDNRDQMLNKIQPFGRAKRLQIWDHNPECILDEYPELSLLPNGDVSSCCNGKMIIGNIRECWDHDTYIERFKELTKHKKCINCPTKTKFSNK